MLRVHWKRAAALGAAHHARIVSTISSEYIVIQGVRCGCWECINQVGPERLLLALSQWPHCDSLSSEATAASCVPNVINKSSHCFTSTRAGADGCGGVPGASSTALSSSRPAGSLKQTGKLDALQTKLTARWLREKPSIEFGYASPIGYELGLGILLRSDPMAISSCWSTGNGVSLLLSICVLQSGHADIDCWLRHKLQSVCRHGNSKGFLLLLLYSSKQTQQCCKSSMFLPLAIHVVRGARNAMRAD